MEEIEQSGVSLKSRTAGGVSLIIPTYNEIGNIRSLVPEIFKNDIELEVILVDDNSPDGTYDAAKDFSKEFPVKAIKRTGKRGLSSAILEGIKHTKFDIIGVMDADFQHPPSFISELYREIQDADIAIASRYIHEEGLETFTSLRKITSNWACILAKPLTSVKDPMSGFFFFRKSVISNVHLSPMGYKILLEILVKGHYNRVKEVPFIIQKRRSGKTKLNIKVLGEYFCHLIKLFVFSTIYRMNHNPIRAEKLPQ